MKRALAAALGLTLGCAARAEGPATPDAPFRYARPPLGALAPVRARAVETGRLANGLRVYVAARPDAPSVEMHFINLRGGDDTERDRPGLAAFAARVFSTFAGRCEGDTLRCAGTPTHWSVDSRMARIHATIPPRTVGTFVAAVARGVRGFELSPALFNQSRDEAANEHRRRGDARRLEDLIQTAVFDDGSLFASLIGGTAEEVGRLRAERVREFIRTRYAPASCALVAVGATTLDEVMAWSERLLAPWSAPPIAPRPTPNAALREGGDRVLLLQSPGRTQAGVLYVVPLRTPDPSRVAAARLLSAAMASNFSSRLQRALRVQRGSTYGVSSSVQSFGGVSLVVVESELEDGRVGDSLVTIRDAFDAVALDGITPDEVEVARRRTIVAWQAASDLPEGITTLLLDGVTDGREPVTSPPPWIDAMARLDAAETNAWLRAELTAATPRVFVRGDPTRLRGELERLEMGPVTLVAPE